MNLKPGDVFKVLEPGGAIAYPGHPFVILLIFGDLVLVGNITDVENEGDLPCLLEPQDAPSILTKTSTFRYQNIREWRVADLARAFSSNKLLYCGELPKVAFQKVVSGAAISRLIKPRYRKLL